MFTTLVDRSIFMKRKIYLFCLISIIVLCTSCQQKINNNLSKETTITETTTSESNTEYTDTSFSSEEAQWSDCDTGLEQSSPNSDIINYTGDCIVDENDFEIFEKYFYGSWVDESGAAPDNIELSYSGSTFSLGFNTLKDIYCDEISAYLVTTVLGETTVYMIDFDFPEIMYEYCETNHGGIPKNQPDFTYSKKTAVEEDSLAFFGILKLHYVDKIPIEVLTGNIIELEDGIKWVNFGEKITILEKSTDEIILKALCRAEEENPYIIGAAEEPLKSCYIIYTILYSENEWKISDCRYVDE